MTGVRRAGGGGASGWRPRIALALVSGFVCLLALAASGTGARAAPPPVPPLPGLLGGVMAEDPLQVTLERELHGFLTADYDQMVKAGCAGALSAYFAAARERDLLQRAYASMLTAHEAMTQTDFSSYALIASRTTQALGETAAFLATAPLAEAQLARIAASSLASPELSALAKRAGNAVIALAKDIGQVASLLVTSESGVTWSDAISGLLNTIGTVKAALSFDVVNKLLPQLKSANAALSSLPVGSVLRVLSLAKAAYDVSADLRRLRADEKAEVAAYDAAWSQYRALLLRLGSAVAAMKSAVAACKPAPESPLGAIPANGRTQSRCAPMSGPHIVHVGKEVTFSAGPRHPEACYGRADYDWPGFEGLTRVSGCEHDAGACVLRATTATRGYAVACLDGSSGFGSWGSCVYYAVVGRDVAIVEGHVTDRDGSPVPGVVVRASGTEGTHASSSAATGADGYYAMEVKAGTYAIDPSGSSFKPASASRSVAPSGTADADFVRQTGIELQLRVDKTTVPADGLQVVSGTVVTRTYGSYGSQARVSQGNVPVQLAVMPGDPVASAVTADPHATVCQQGGGRLWPQGSLNAPNGNPISITTDASGRYSFAITVGTKPGVWRLRAWAINADGQLSLDQADASRTASVTFAAPGTASLSSAGFVAALRSLSQPGEGNVVNNVTNPGGLAGVLAGLSAQGGAGGVYLHGLAYAVINGKDGQALLVYPAGRPPAIDAKGALVLSAGDASDLILAPGEWTGGSLPPNANSLQSAVSNAQYPLEIPTFTEWAAGAHLAGWKTVHGNAASIASGSFQWFGWAYPGIATPGACY